MASSIYLVRLGVETSMALSFSSILFSSSSIFCCAAVPPFQELILSIARFAASFATFSESMPAAS